MIISVKVKPQAKQEKIEKIKENCFAVWVREPARDGKANEAVVRLISQLFGVPKSLVVIKRGIRGKNKLIEII